MQTWVYSGHAIADNNSAVCFQHPPWPSDRQHVRQGCPACRCSCSFAARAPHRPSSHVSQECDVTLLLGSKFSKSDSGQALQHSVANSHLLRGHVLVGACSQVGPERGTENVLQEKWERTLRICRPWRRPQGHLRDLIRPTWELQGASRCRQLPGSPARSVQCRL